MYRLRYQRSRLVLSAGDNELWWVLRRLGWAEAVAVVMLPLDELPLDALGDAG